MSCGCDTNRTGQAVRIIGRKHWGEGTVVRDNCGPGLDGRHWLAVQIGVLHYEVECREVVEVRQ